MSSFRQAEKILLDSAATPLSEVPQSRRLNDLDLEKDNNNHTKKQLMLNA